MTNLFALCLIVTSLTAAALWSPQHRYHHEQEDVIVKEGHRVVVVEYGDQGQHNTKVSISSEPDQDASQSERHRTTDLICDAFGKCKHKVASVVDKAKTMVGDQVVADAFDEAKETVSDKSHRVRESVEEGREDADVFLEKTKETVGVKVAEKIIKAAAAGGNKLKENVILVLVNRPGVKAAMDVLSLLGFSMALGMGVWTTFISSYVLAIALPRQQLAVVQTKIYPVYFRAMASSIGMALFGHLFSHTKWPYSIQQGYVLVAALLMIFANSLYMEPRATKVMFERLKMEKEEGRGIEDITAHPPPPAITTTTSTPTPTPTEVIVDRELVKSRIEGLNKRLKKLNSYSSLLNLLTLMALTCHLVYLSQRLRVPPSPC